MRLRVPEPPSRPALAAFALVWTGVSCGRHGWWAALLAIGGLVAVQPPWRKMVGLAIGALAAGALAGFLSTDGQPGLAATTALPTGSQTVLMVAATDVQESRFGGFWFIGRPVAIQSSVPGPEVGWLDWQGPRLLVDVPATRSDSVIGVQSGERLQVSGIVRSRLDATAKGSFAGIIAATEIAEVGGGANPLVSAGNALRHRVVSRLQNRGAGAALVSGFLVGAIEELPQVDLDALRLAGISHYVAVSGANVAGFLLLWFIVIGPLGVGGRRRGLIGLPAIALYATATRWEPSVVRASLMAGVVLAGRAVGIPVDAWTALGWSGALALVVAPALTESLGFQLSVLATAGIMLGNDLLPASLPRWLRASLGSTLAAQAAVTPLLLVVFGSVPLVSPLSNLIAAPLVSIATLLGGLGTMTGLEPLIWIAITLAEFVLDLAHLAAAFPQLSLVGVGLIVAGLFAARSTRLRPFVAFAAALALAWSGWGTPAVVPPAVVFLDVGQGDASLVLGGDGSIVLVDAGPEPPELASALRRYGVGRVDLMVVTHPHEDHVAGLVGLVERIPIGRVWAGGRGHTGESWELVSAQLASRGVPIQTPPVGTVETHGGIRIEVLGPIRRYAGANDQSIVLRVSAGSTTALLTGDIEVAAQADLEGVEADVLKVPHHGGATSSLAWLASTDPRIAVVSVGENDYGHPNAQVLEMLAAIGAVVIRTDQVGDVVIPLTGDPLRRLPVVPSLRGP